MKIADFITVYHLYDQVYNSCLIYFLSRRGAMSHPALPNMYDSIRLVEKFFKTLFMLVESGVCLCVGGGGVGWGGVGGGGGDRGRAGRA